jgi:hypothetical protein
MLCAAGLANASSQRLQKAIRGIAGEEIRVAVLGSPRPDCTAGPRPQVRVVELPKNGTVRVGPRTLSTSRIRNCPRIDVPVTIVFYTSRSGFSGTDAFTLEVTLSSGAIEIQNVTVDVQASI